MTSLPHREKHLWVESLGSLTGMARASRPVRPRRPSMVPPEKIRTIDDVERKFVWGLVVFGAVLSTLFLFVHQTGYTTKAPNNGACSDGWELVKSTCQQAYTMTFKEYLPQFLACLLGTTVLGVSAWRRHRVLASFTALMMGLMLSTVGLPYLMLGGWLILRAWRLSRYGVAAFVASNQAARQQAIERRGQRSPRGARATSLDNDTRRPPSANKRYTPKKSNGSRR